MPRIGTEENVWLNGLYEAFAIIVAFPLIVYMGASGKVTGKFATKLTRFFGDLSYPLYITHYPLIYIFTAWVIDNKILLKDGWPMAVLVLVSAISIAYGAMKLYDVPVRNWLAKRFMHKTVK